MRIEAYDWASDEHLLGEVTSANEIYASPRQRGIFIEVDPDEWSEYLEVRTRFLQLNRKLMKRYRMVVRLRSTQIEDMPNGEA